MNDPKRELDSLNQIERGSLGPRDARRLDHRKQYLRKVLGAPSPIGRNVSMLPKALEVLGDSEMTIKTLAYRSGVGVLGIRLYIKAGHIEIVRYERDKHNKLDRHGTAIIRKAR